MKDAILDIVAFLFIMLAFTLWSKHMYDSGYDKGFDKARNIACSKQYAPYYEELCP